MRDTNDDNEDDEIEHKVITDHLHVKKRPLKSQFQTLLKRDLVQQIRCFEYLIN